VQRGAGHATTDREFDRLRVAPVFIDWEFEFGGKMEHNPRMVADPNTPPAKPEPPQFGTGSFLFALVLLVLFYMLAHSMVRHGFFRGEQVQQNGSLGH
jgi:hypothetical protein